jgi:flagellar protein FliS
VNPYANPRAYQEQAILTATPGQLVVMLYDGIVRFLRQADAAFEARAIAQAHERLGRAEAIVDELQATLDMSQGSVAENLEGIYVFWKGCIMEIRLEQDREKLQRIVAQVANLREAWAQIAQSAEATSAAA